MHEVPAAKEIGTDSRRRPTRPPSQCDARVLTTAAGGRLLPLGRVNLRVRAVASREHVLRRGGWDYHSPLRHPLGRPSGTPSGAALWDIPWVSPLGHPLGEQAGSAAAGTVDCQWDIAATAATSCRRCPRRRNLAHPPEQGWGRWLRGWFPGTGIWSCTAERSQPVWINAAAAAAVASAERGQDWMPFLRKDVS